MNKIAYRTTGLAVKTLSGLSKARINVYGKVSLPESPAIYVINHFTRIETLIIPYQVFKLTGMPAWSLADDTFFKGTFGALLDKIGAISTKDPDRDRLIVKTLLTGEANWVIYPEGRMVKNKKIVEQGRYMISYAGGKHPPHTGAASLALRTEFYRQRIKQLTRSAPAETQRLLDLFEIDSVDAVTDSRVHIVPVNVTYYPIRARENMLSRMAQSLLEEVPERLLEELMTEGSMLMSGVDVDIRFGEPIRVDEYISRDRIQRDVVSTRRIDFDDAIPSKRLMRRLSLHIMQRYMSQIYCLTTVNHDHLFASLLRMTPRKRIGSYDLTQKVYAAATMNLTDMGVNCHEDLTKDQIHLLSDDRFDKRSNFESVAIEKDVIRKERAVLEKVGALFSSTFDFHRIRIDNPIGVMANEIEPLSALQRKLRMIAWMPSFWVRRKIAARLRSKAIAEYLRDYRDFYQQDDAKDVKNGMPLLYRSSGRSDLGILLVHGYLSAPPEVEALAQYLAGLKHNVYAPRLKGHGTSPDDLAVRSYQDWIASVEEGYALIRCYCRRVVLGGFSTGAGLVLDLAERLGNAAGVFAVCPPMRLQDLSSRLVPAVDVWNRMMKKVHLEGAQKAFVENSPENPHINYFRNPISGVRELERLMESVESRLDNIHVPALVVQSQGDPVVNPEGSRRAFEMLGSEKKEYQLFNFDRHGILLGAGSERVHRAIGDFVKRL